MKNKVLWFVFGGFLMIILMFLEANLGIADFLGKAFLKLFPFFMSLFELWAIYMAFELLRWKDRTGRTWILVGLSTTQGFLTLYGLLTHYDLVGWDYVYGTLRVGTLVVGTYLITRWTKHD